MSRIAYVNGCYVAHGEAAVHIEDRGYQFADGVYEVFGVQDGRLLGEAGHMDRLGYSLAALRIDWPMPRPVLRHVIGEVVRRNRVRDGIVYLQITRGVAPRDHGFPKVPVPPSLVVTAKMMPPFRAIDFEQGLGVITTPDIRWKRKDIKSISLLPNVLGKQQALDAGCYEAWLIDDDGMVTEGVATNAWIVTAADELVIRHATTDILNGITRLTLLDIVEEVGVTLVERAFSVAEARQAREAFISSSNSPVRAVTRIDGDPVGDGRVGPVTRRLIGALLNYYDDARDPAIRHPGADA